MLQQTIRFSLIVTAFGLLSCQKLHSPNENTTHLTESERITTKLVATGGTPADFAVCASSPYDTIIPITHLHPAPAEGEPEMTVEGIDRFIRENEITTIDELVNELPAHYRNNFSLVEITRATGESNLQYPRIILFGPDGYFLANIGTKPDDPKYNLLDVAQLHEDTGKWEFSVFDFNGETPTLNRNDESCIECHGDKNSRPVWGTNLMWPGVFGDNVAKGPQGEALDHRHAIRMNEIMAGKGGSPRFDFLEWDPAELKRGGKRKIAHHILGVDLFLSNIAMGTATARGAFTRLKNNFPKKYQSLREEILLAYYLKKNNTYISDRDKVVINSLNAQLGIDEFSLNNLLSALGVDTNEAFSLATLAHKEQPRGTWKMGRGDLHDMLMLQILDDLKHDNAEINTLLSNRVLPEMVFGCPDTAQSIADVVDYKMLHLFHLRGRARYEVNKVFYPLDSDDIYQRVFLPVSAKLVPYLKQNISSKL